MSLVKGQCALFVSSLCFECVVEICLPCITSPPIRFPSPQMAYPIDVTLLLELLHLLQHSFIHYLSTSLLKLNWQRRPSFTSTILLIDQFKMTKRTCSVLITLLWQNHKTALGPKKKTSQMQMINRCLVSKYSPHFLRRFGIETISLAIENETHRRSEHPNWNIDGEKSTTSHFSLFHDRHCWFCCCGMRKKICHAKTENDKLREVHERSSWKVFLQSHIFFPIPQQQNQQCRQWKREKWDAALFSPSIFQLRSSLRLCVSFSIASEIVSMPKRRRKWGEYFDTSHRLNHLHLRCFPHWTFSRQAERIFRKEKSFS